MRNKIIGACAVLLVAVFLIGIVELFLLRFAAGDVYPPYSSLRADPYGTRALYESLERIPGAIVVRHLKPFNLLEGAECVAFYTGTHPQVLQRASNKELERFEAVVQRGARLIITLQPVRDKPEVKLGRSIIEERWGVRLAYSPESEDLPPSQTLLYFDHPDKNWQTLQQGAVIARGIGKGSIVLAANAYLLSNEALLTSRDTDLLAAII